MSLKLTPLFNSRNEFFKQDRDCTATSDYPSILQFITDVSADVPDANKDLIAVRDFLWTKGRKSEATFNAFRSEAERFLLWAWTVQKKSIAVLKKRDIEEYIDFVHAPPKAWIGIKNVRRFRMKEGLYVVNPDWRPFVVRIPKSTIYLRKKENALRVTQGLKPLPDPKPDPTSYALANKSLVEVFSNLSVLYTHLVDMDYAYGNCILSVRKNCPYLINDVSNEKVKRLSDIQWDFVLSNTRSLANSDARWETHLFIVAILKSLYLRVSELSVRDAWTPLMKHFYKSDDYWWFTVYGKGAKKRKVSVPDDFLSYLARYRASRGLSDLPSISENEPLIKPINKHNHGLKERMVAHYVQEAFNAAFECMIDEGFVEDAQNLLAASSHWLRHTGASADVEHRPILDLSADLGHGTIATTDKEYLHSDDSRRAESGKKRSV